MNHLEIRHLRMLLAIANTGNMTRAAEHLHISQSALSQQLKDIETKLGTALFLRTRKKMVLSADGRALLGTARDVVAAVETAEGELISRTKGETGELRLGTQCVFCYKWLPQVMQEFRRQYPGVTPSIATSSSYRHDLLNESFDLVITGAQPETNDFELQTLFSDQLVCVMNTNHLLSEKNYLEFTDFSEECLLGHTTRERNILVHRFLEPRGIAPAKYMEIGVPQAMLELVAAGFGLAVFPRWAISDVLQQSYAAPITSRPIGPKGLTMNWNAIWSARKDVPVYLQEFIRLVGTGIQSLVTPY